MKYIQQPILFGLQLFLFSFLVVNFGGCQQPSSTTTNAGDAPDLKNLILLKDTLSGPYQINILAQDSLLDKNETLYIQIKDSTGKPLENTELDYNMRMDMGMMSHGGPYAPITKLGNGLFKAEVVFIMANMEGMGKGWLFEGVINKRDSINIPLQVHKAPNLRTTAVNSLEDGRFFVSCILPQKTTAGIQKVNFTLHKIEQHDFPPLDGYSLEVEPFMPDMGHGSANNEPAQGRGEGHYQGTINLSMPGLWQIKVRLFKNGNKAVEEELIFPIQVI